MVVTVTGKMKKPYNMNGKSGISCRVSMCCGEYYNDVLSGQIGEGQQYIEVKCPEKIFDLLALNDEINVELDDGKTRIKDIMVKNPDGSFSPINGL